MPYLALLAREPPPKNLDIRNRALLPRHRQRPTPFGENNPGCGGSGSGGRLSRLARIRKERGYTQTELPQKIGITQALVTDYERDKLRMYVEMAVRFARALEISTDELLGIQPTRAAGKLSLKLVRRLQKLEQLSDSKQRVLLQTIDGFLRGEGISS